MGKAYAIEIIRDEFTEGGRTYATTPKMWQKATAKALKEYGREELIKEEGKK